MDGKNVRAMMTKEIPPVDIKEMAIYTGLSLISRGMSVSLFKLQVLLYYEQAWFMVFFGRGNSLFKDIPQAWSCCPIYSVIYDEYKLKVEDLCEHLQIGHFIENDLEQTIKAIEIKNGWDNEIVDLLGSIIALYGSKTQTQLAFLVHAEGPWCEKRGDLLPFERSDEYISLDSMHDYYKARYMRNRQQ